MRSMAEWTKVTVSNIDMEDIAEVTVLTGPSAAALYGGQAANGVIMLTSKQGGLKDGKPRISFSHYSDFYQPLLLPKLQNTYGSRTDEFGDRSWRLLRIMIRQISLTQA